MSIPPPDRLPAYPEARLVRPKTRMHGRLLKRWKDASALYEWDYLHGTIEMYDLRGRHLGEFDPTDGRMLKRPIAHRKVDP